MCSRVVSPAECPRVIGFCPLSRDALSYKYPDRLLSQAAGGMDYGEVGGGVRVLLVSERDTQKERGREEGRDGERECKRVRMSRKEICRESKRGR